MDYVLSKKLVEGLKYFKRVVNSVFKEEPEENSIISIEELYLAYLKTTNKPRLQEGFKGFEKIMKYVMRELQMDMYGYNEDIYFKTDLWKISDETLYIGKDMVVLDIGK